MSDWSETPKTSLRTTRLILRLTAGKGVQIWAKISVDEDAVSLEDLEAMLSGLVLTSLGEEAMNFEHKLYKVSGKEVKGIC